jgi:hypothetical protein
MLHVIREFVYVAMENMVYWKLYRGRSEKNMEW